MAQADAPTRQRPGAFLAFGLRTDAARAGLRSSSVSSVESVATARARESGRACNAAHASPDSARRRGALRSVNVRGRTSPRSSFSHLNGIAYGARLRARTA